MRGVDDDDVDSCADERVDPLIGPLPGTDRGPDPKLLVFVLARIGVLVRLLNVLDGHQPAQLEALVHHQHLLDAVGVQEPADLAPGSALAHRDESVLRCHHVRDRVVVVGLETQVAVGHDADELRAIHHRYSRNVVLARERDDLADARSRRHRNGIGDDPALELLDHTNLPGLRLRRHVLVDDADAAGLRDADREPRLGDRVHGRGHEGNVQIDLPGEPRGELGIAGKHLGVTGNQENVVERECLLHLEHRAKLPGR